VDRDALGQPPRSVQDTILNRALILRVLMSAVTIISGTLFIFWKEVRSAVLVFTAQLLDRCSMGPHSGGQEQGAARGKWSTGWREAVEDVMRSPEQSPNAPTVFTVTGQLLKDPPGLAAWGIGMGAMFSSAEKGIPLWTTPV
jgi:hypothetical protein